MTKHTPGPWTLKVGKYGAPHEVSWAPGKSYGLIARINARGIQELPEAKTDAEIEANARLIAAAPEMAELLRDLDALGIIQAVPRERARALLARIDAD